MSTYSKIRILAESLVKNAGKKILDQQSTFAITQYKDRQDICTTADLMAEKIIITGIQSQYPNHQIQSEEAGIIGRSSEYRWIIDPLDGTKEFIRGIPQFNCSVAVEKNGELVAAAIYRPSDEQLYSASLGDGALLNNQPIRVSTTTTLADSFVYCYLPSYTRNPELYATSWSHLGKIGEKVYRLRSYADENTILCWLAQGGHEAYVNLSNPPKWHDIAPGLFIAKEAGAYIPAILIASHRAGQETSIIITNSATIHQEIESIIRS